MNAAIRNLSFFGIAALLTHCAANDGSSSSSSSGKDSTDGNTVAANASSNDAEGKAADGRNGLTELVGSGQRVARSSDIAADAKAYAAREAAKAGVANPAFTTSIVTTGIDSVQHVRLAQVHNGIKVFGADVVVHADDQELIDVAGTVALKIDVDMTATVDEASILPQAKAERFGSRAVETTDESVEKVIYIDTAGVQHLAFHSTFSNDADTDVAPGRWNGIWDAQTGKLLARWNAIDSLAQASGPGGNAKFNHPWVNQLDVETKNSGYVMTTTALKTLNMKNGTTTGTEVTGTSLDGFSDSVINDAHGYAELTLGVMKLFGFNSIDNNGFQIVSRVHYSRNYENAFWNGSTMTYGDGASTFYPLSGAIDVVAHEIHHGFTEKHSGLAYSGEAGGLNEGFSDIAGKIAEFMDQPTTANFNIGEQIYKQQGKALRYMCDPRKDGTSIDNASQMTSSLDPHYSSGVPNKWFCMAARRFSSPGLDDNTATATADGVKRAGQAIYLANASYWTSSTSFTQACKGTVDAARSLQYSDAEVAAIKASWRDVGVYCDGDAAPPPPCDETLTDASGTLTSPNYPKNYPNNFKKTWCIDAPAGQKVTLSFTDFATEAGYDYVSLGNEVGAIQSKTAGSTKPASITASRVYVTFTSDSSQTKKGWSANWTTK